MKIQLTFNGTWIALGILTAAAAFKISAPKVPDYVNFIAKTYEFV